jgi:predicted SAM-dependent methyltransferase
MEKTAGSWKAGLMVSFNALPPPAEFYNGLEESDLPNLSGLEIGGGDSNRLVANWLNIDPVHGDGDLKRLAQDIPWPIPSNSIDRVYASHVMEHIPAGEDRINVMNEAHRVLKRGGRFLIQVPLLCDENVGVVYFTSIADPTHVSFWTRSSFSYFDKTMTASADYGINQWNTLSFDTKRARWEGRWVGTPVKDVGLGKAVIPVW